MLFTVSDAASRF